MNSKIRVIFVAVAIAVILPSFCTASPDTAKAHKPNQKSVELNEKGAVAMKAHDNEAAEKLFKQAYDLDSTNVTAAYNLAGAYVANKKEKDAIALLTKITKTVKNDAGLFARLGDVYFSDQNITDAAKSYEESLAIDADYPTVPMKLAAIYAMKNRMSDSEKMFERALKQTPQDPKVLANYASILLANNKPDDAIRAAKNSLQYKVEAETYITLGQSYESLKDPQNAIIAYEKAIALGKKSPEVISRVKELKEIVAKNG